MNQLKETCFKCFKFEFGLFWVKKSLTTMKEYCKDKMTRKEFQLFFQAFKILVKKKNSKRMSMQLIYTSARNFFLEEALAHRNAMAGPS